MNDAIVHLVPALAQTLLSFVWQGGAIGAIAAVLLFALRRASPQARYLVVCLALLACVVVPVATFVDLVRGDAGATTPSSAWSRVNLAIGNAAASAAVVDGGSGHAPWMVHAVLAWAAGVVVFSSRTALGLLWIARLQRGSRSAAQTEWQARLDALAARFGLARDVRLHLVERLHSPVSVGWWKPVVLLPASLVTRMPRELIEALLAHELAHIKRHDYLINVLQSVVEALLFFHPVVWWLSRQARLERELVADRIAAQALESPHRLAVALAQLSELGAKRTPSFHLAQAAQGGHLMSRIQQLLKPQQARAGRVVLPLLGIAVACIGFYAHARLDAERTPARDPVSTPRDAAAATRLERAERSFAIVEDARDGIILSGSTRDVDEIRSLRNRIAGDFIWFRHDDRGYVVTDPQLVARARSAWRESEAVARRMEALGAEMHQHGKKLEILGERMQALGEAHESNAAMHGAQKRLAELAGQQQKLAARQAALAAEWAARRDDDASARREQEARAIEQQLEAIEQQMEAETDRIAAEAERASAPMEAMAAEMERAAEPMEALGRQMEALGQRQEALSKKAEREVEALLRHALDQGLARPVEKG